MRILASVLLFGWAQCCLHGGETAIQAADNPRSKNPAHQTQHAETRWFSSDSPFNRSTAGAAVHPDSDAMVRYLLGGISAININQGDWTPTVFRAPAGTPRVRMVSEDHAWTIDNTPDPSAIKFVTSVGDKQGVIIDESTQLFYNFGGGKGVYKDSTGTWRYSAGGILSLSGSGTWNNCPGPWIQHASGISLLAGLIRPEDISTDLIGHALAIAIPKTMIYGPAGGATGISWCDAVYPATTTDGASATSPIKMGTWLALDPSVCVDTVALNRGERLLLKALQDYGAFVCDSCGNGLLAFYAQNTNSSGAENYPPEWSLGIRGERVAQILSKLRVLNPPAKRVAHDSPALTGQPHRGI